MSKNVACFTDLHFSNIAVKKKTNLYVIVVQTIKPKIVRFVLFFVALKRSAHSLSPVAWILVFITWGDDSKSKCNGGVPFTQHISAYAHS